VGFDARDSSTILADPAISDLLADGRPVALMLISALMYFDDTNARIVSTLAGRLPPGSRVVISHPTDDFSPAAARAAVAAAGASGITYRPRTHLLRV
jgi:O-methyltransferase involved in polyketide biosynthesis